VISGKGSLGLGATKFETLRHVILPCALPGILTGLILAMARAAGEVAPLMLTGVVKLAPALPLDEYLPFLHLDRKFMHLGFHIYDVGFQSPNVEAAKPMVYMTTLILILVVVLLNWRRCGCAIVCGDDLPPRRCDHRKDCAWISRLAAVADGPHVTVRPSFRNRASPSPRGARNLRRCKMLVRNLDFYYGQRQALFRVSLTVRTHSVTSFIGPSGCGKSTLLRCLNRMNDLVEGARAVGRVELDGVDIYDPVIDVTDLRKRVGWSFRNRTRFPNRSTTMSHTGRVARHQG
jgi:ABC-type multidrug transport system fused ATPase/permease subunit